MTEHKMRLCSNGHVLEKINKVPYLHPNGPHWVNCFLCNNPIVKCESIEDHNVVKNEFLHCKECSEDHCITCENKTNSSSRNLINFLNKKVEKSNPNTRLGKAISFIEGFNPRPKLHPQQSTESFRREMLEASKKHDEFFAK